jgi:hypothetical protein
MVDLYDSRPHSFLIENVLFSKLVNIVLTFDSLVSQQNIKVISPPWGQ